LCYQSEQCRECLKTLAHAKYNCMVEYISVAFRTETFPIFANDEPQVVMTPMLASCTSRQYRYRLQDAIGLSVSRVINTELISLFEPLSTWHMRQSGIHLTRIMVCGCLRMRKQSKAARMLAMCPNRADKHCSSTSQILYEQ